MTFKDTIFLAFLTLWTGFAARYYSYDETEKRLVRDAARSKAKARAHLKVVK